MTKTTYRRVEYNFATYHGRTGDGRHKLTGERVTARRIDWLEAWIDDEGNVTIWTDDCDSSWDTGTPKHKAVSKIARQALEEKLKWEAYKHDHNEQYIKWLMRRLSGY